MDVYISIIVPTYNTENYIGECLESIISQSLANIEILCIDDGSSDNTIKIIEDNINIDNRIKLLKQSHKGASSARNNAMENVSGKYIMFVDGDDILPDTTVLETLYSEAERHEVEICGGNVILFDKDWNTGAKYPAYKNPVFIKDEEVSFVDYGNPYGFTQFIYKRALLIENEIYFPPYKCWEDPIFLASAFSKAERFYALRRYVYCYRRSIHKKEHRMQDMFDLLFASVDLMRIGNETQNLKLQKKTLDVLYEHLFKFLQAYEYDSSLFRKKINEIAQLTCCSVKKEYKEQMIVLDETYYEREIKKLKQDEKKLIDECKKKQVIIYGAGVYGSRLYALLEKNNVSVYGFCVTYKSDGMECLYNIPLKSFDDWLTDDDISSRVFIVSVYDEKQRRIIKQRLTEEKMSTIDINLDILDEKLEVNYG